MRNLLTKYNIEETIKEIGSTIGKSVMINNVWISGIKAIEAEFTPIDESIPEHDRDGSEENRIDVNLIIDNGRVSISFCPEHEACEIWHETKDLILIRVQDTTMYIEQERKHLEFLEKQYKEYMSK